MMRVVALLACAVLTSGCLQSKVPVFNADSRTLPFASPVKAEIYSRAEPREPWTKGEQATFVADASLTVREIGQDGKPKSELYTFHPIDLQKYVVQIRWGQDGPYSYHLLVVRNGEMFGSALTCDKLSPPNLDAIKRAGGRIENSGRDQKCILDGVARPVELLKSIALQDHPPDFRYVPIK